MREDTEIVDVFNKYFSSVFTEEDTKNFNFSSTQSSHPNSSNEPVVKKDVIKKYTIDIKNKKSSGPDGL